MKICLLTKREKYGVKEAISFTKNISSDIDIYYGDIKTKFPQEIRRNKYDILISYISPWIVPKEILNITKQWNLNFHPGPPEYPGIGCFNFAIFNSEKQFGATAHIMEPKVDVGRIVGVERFIMENKETVDSLSRKTYKAQLLLYKNIIKHIQNYNCLPQCNEEWKRKPYKRNELEDLATIRVEMSEKEIKKRIRATYYPGKPAPFIDLKGHRFEFNPER